MTLQYFNRKPFSIGEGGDTYIYYEAPLKLLYIESEEPLKLLYIQSEDELGILEIDE